MRIDGKAIAGSILQELAKNVSKLKEQCITPTLAVIQIGNDFSSTAYIHQKKKAAERIGAVLKHEKLPVNISYQHVNTLIHAYNADPTVHGLIIQRPLPKDLATNSSILNTVDLQKDIDGFVPNSPFEAPVATAVIRILEEIHTLTGSDPVNQGFDDWIKSKTIVIIGRGETAGKPITDALMKRGCNLSIVHSQTSNPQEIIKQADIIISCVGRSRVITPDIIKRGAILIGVGIHHDTKGDVRGDYEENKIADKAAAFTPTPGGVGPVNVACLMQNLVKACILQKPSFA